MTASEIRALFAVASRPEVVSLAGGMPYLSALPLDVVGNATDDAGDSIDPHGRRIDPAGYFAAVAPGGGLREDAQRDAEYTRGLGEDGDALGIAGPGELGERPRIPRNFRVSVHAAALQGHEIRPDVAFFEHEHFDAQRARALDRGVHGHRYGQRPVTRRLRIVDEVVPSEIPARA